MIIRIEDLTKIQKRLVLDISIKWMTGKQESILHLVLFVNGNVNYVVVELTVELLLIILLYQS